MKLGASLLEAIYADPDDDDARAVYADWLQDRGDPLGELITLQLARLRARPTQAALRRERSLIAQHREAWLGPLWSVVRHTHVRFERGFVDEVRLRPLIKPKQLAAAIGERRWRTVRTLDVWGFDYPELVLHEVMRDLRMLHSVPQRLAIALLTDPHPRSLHTLELQRSIDATMRDTLIGAIGVPALRHLQFSFERGPDELDWLWASTLGRQLDTLTLHGAASPRAWSESAGVPSNIVAVHFQSKGGVVTLRRGPSGALEET